MADEAVAELDRRLDGGPARQKLYESDIPSIDERIWAIRDGHWQTRQMPTATQRRDLDIAKAGLDALERDLNALITGDLAKLEEAFAAAGAPWIPGRRGRQAARHRPNGPGEHSPGMRPKADSLGSNDRHDRAA